MTARASAFAPFRVSLARPARFPGHGGRGLRPEERLFNRDLSWLNFNDRVLGEAADPRTPALERLRFVAIVSSNLDEFFMVRVADLARLARRRPSYRFPDGLRAPQVLAQVREHVLRQKSRQATVFEDTVAALWREGIRIHTAFDAARALDALVQPRLPALNLCLRRSSDPMPTLWSERIHVFVRFPGEYAVISIVEREGRLVELPASSGARRYALAERWLAARASRLFPDREVIEAFPFKIIRSADLRYRPDDEESLEAQILTAVELRRKARAVRLEVDAPAYSEGVLALATALGIDSAGLYRFELPLDLRTLARIYRDVPSEKLRYPPVHPQVPPPFRKSRGIFETIRRRDILLHHPYDSFDIVVHFVEAAAADPLVTAIRHTVYRTSRESPTLAALQEAARRGKAVTVYVEIKARFDELNNVRWADELRRAGVRVVRPLGDDKVHSKLTQVIRREGDRDESYLHLGTGNYHPVTARQYTDLGLLTCDALLGREVSAYFEAMAGGHPPPALVDLLVAPDALHERLLRLIQREIHEQRGGRRGHIIAKMNSLADPALIEALYQASAAGVTVELLVRGICCLVPGVKGLSEHIRVVSVVDRFLEHSRIYYFRAGGEERIYLSSADWMPRNFFTRHEIAFPVKDAALKRHIRDVILEKGLQDNVKSWTLRPDGSYARETPASPRREVRSQFLFEALAHADYSGTPLAQRVGA